MGRIIISENVSLDGVVEIEPEGREPGPRDWHGLLTADDRDAWYARLLAEAHAAEAILMGRGTYEFFATHHPSRTDPLAERMNSMPKYVVSTTVNTLDALGVDRWQHSSLLSGKPVDAIKALRQEVDGDIVVYASPELVPTLLDHDLADELRLMTYPVVVGAGRRLFGGSAAMRPVRLDAVRTVGNALALLTYQSVRGASA